MKTKEYIDSYTRRCSNEIFDGEYQPWMTIEDVEATVEIERKEVVSQIEEIINTTGLSDKERIERLKEKIKEISKKK